MRALVVIHVINVTILASEEVSERTITHVGTYFDIQNCLNKDIQVLGSSR